MSKILILDIETKPTKAWVWRGFKENIAPEQVIEAGGMICFGAKWHGKKGVEFYSEWEHGHKGMLEAAHRLLSEADIVVGFNHDKFDIPHMFTEFILAGMDMPPPLTTVDLQKTLRSKFRFFSNRLKFVGPELEIGKKVEHEGFSLWTKVMDGHENSRRKMRRYCIQDVALTERLYKTMRPFITNHPNPGHTGDKCPTCGSDHTQKRGKRYTRTMEIQRNQCQKCKSWFETTRSKIKKDGHRDSQAH